MTMQTASAVLEEKQMKKSIGVDFFCDAQYISHLACKDGMYYFIVKQGNLKENTYDSDLYCLKNGTPVRLTTSRDVKDFALLDEGIVFPCLRDKQDKAEAEQGLPLTVFQLLPYDGGEAREYMRLAYAVEQAEWLPGKRLLFRAVYDHAWEAALIKCNGNREDALKMRKEDAEGYTIVDELPFWFNDMGFINKKRSALFLYDKEVRMLSTPMANVAKIVLSKDKSQALFSQKVYAEMAPASDSLVWMDALTGACRPIALDFQAAIKDYVFEDSKHAYVVAQPIDEKGAPVLLNPGLYRVGLTDGLVQPLETSGMYNYANAVGTDIKLGTQDHGLLMKDGKVSFVATAGHDSHIIMFDPVARAVHQVTKEPGMVQEAIITDNGFALVAMRGNGLGEIYDLDMQGGETKISTFNDALLNDCEISTPRQLSFINSEGTEIFGWVMLPVGYEPGKKVPAILNIHGGPKASYGSVFFHEMQYWCASGYAVLFCNPTGGDGRGSRFADIRGRYGTIDYEDIMTFVDECLKRYDIIDENRLGVTGGSYGGYMTNWIIGHTHRFHAAASQRSIANWLGFNFTSDIGYTFGEDQMQGTIWAEHDKIWEASPLKHIYQAKTPTLFLHSDQDYRCNMFEGIQMFSALRRLGVETRLCLFKGENHELSRSGKPKNRITRLQEITCWMDGHLK